MKKLIVLSAILLVFLTNIKAQAPHSFKYQAIARDNKGEIITNQILGMRISILQGEIEGGEIYVETHQVNSNKFGLINLEIGNGINISGDFDSIDWSTGPYFVKIETDETGGDNYKVLGTSQLLSVPYALYAEKAGNFNLIDTNCINLNCSPWIKNGNKIYYNKGNVGIGTSNPGYLLDIQGDADVSSITPRQFLFLHNKNNSIHSNVAVHLRSGTDINEAAGSVGVAAFSYIAAPALEGYTYLYSNYSGIALRARNSEGIIKFITGGNEVINERMRIAANGNIGIGTNIPMTKLEIADGNVYINGLNKGIIMRSPDEQCWKITVENDGSLISSPIACPE
jgi:hypothetical protein